MRWYSPSSARSWIIQTMNTSFLGSYHHSVPATPFHEKVPLPVVFVLVSSITSDMPRPKPMPAPGKNRPLRADLRRGLVDHHQRFGFRLQDLHAVIRAVISQHQDEAEIVFRRRGDAAAALHVGGGRCVVVIEAHAGDQRLDVLRLGEARSLVLRLVEGRVGHAERAGDALLHDNVEGLLRDHFDHAAQHVEAVAVVPGRARLGDQRQLGVDLFGESFAVRSERISPPSIQIFEIGWPAVTKP